MSYHYFLAVDGVADSEHEVTKEEFVAAERRAGFRNLLDQPYEPATAGFSAHGVQGRVVWFADDAENEEPS